jgi:hypothetical protein
MPKNKRFVFDVNNPKAAFAIVVSTYGAIVRRNLIQKKRKSITSYYSNFKDCFRTIICDEAHIIKNPNTLWARCLKLILAPLRIIVTATPIMHTRKDLLGLLTFCYDDDFELDIQEWEMCEFGSGLQEDSEGMEFYEAINNLDKLDRRRYYALNPAK